MREAGMYVINIVLNAWDVERDALFYLRLTKKRTPA